MSKLQQTDPHVLLDDDGYTLTRYIAAEPRMYGALRFTYRPVSSIKRAKFRDKKRLGETEAQSLERHAIATASRLVEWNALGLDGKPLPPTTEGVLALHPVLLTRLMSIVVLSTEGGDLDPDAESPQEPHSEQDPFGDETDDELVEGSRKNS